MNGVLGPHVPHHVHTVLNVEEGSVTNHFQDIMGKIAVTCSLKIRPATLDRVLSTVDLVIGKSGEIVQLHVEVE